MPISAYLLACLDAISYETTRMLDVLDEHADTLPANDVREAKRRVFEIRAGAHELFEWISEARLEDPRN